MGRSGSKHVWEYRVALGLSVKSRAVSRVPGMAILGAWLAFSLVQLPKARATEPGDASLLLGGGNAIEKSAVLVDPRLPRGRLREAAEHHVPLSRRCSARRPVCVSGLEGEAAQSALGLLEAAYERHRFGAGLPGPHGQTDQGLDWAPGPAPLQLLLAEEPALGFDRARARCQGGQRTSRDAQRCVTEAALGEFVPATAESLRSGYATAATQELLGLGPEDLRLLADSARAPERARLSRTPSGPPPDGSAWFFRYLSDVARDSSAAAPGFLALGLAPTKTDPAALRFDAEPDLFDVLRASWKDDRKTYAEFFDDFAAARREPSAWLGISGAEYSAELAWSIASDSLPRNLMLPRALEPTGSSYVRIELAGESPNSSIALRISCEGPVSWVWSVTRLGAAGQELARVRLAFQERARVFEQRIGPLETSRALIVIGTNLGGVDLAHPFDPDHGPHEAHACTLYVTRLP